MLISDYLPNLSFGRAGGGGGEAKELAGTTKKSVSNLVVLEDIHT